PIAHNSDLQVTVDWRALRRWNLPDSALPPGSVIINREPSFWERDRNYIIAAVLVILAQSLLIAGLLWQRARKQKAEAVLRESEKRFRVMADTTPSLIWIADQNGKITYLNSKSVEFTGDPRAGFGDSWSEYVHPDDLDGVLSANARALAKRLSFSKEYRLRRHDGVYRWMFDVASPRVNGDGSFAGFIGSAIDITDQKMAQEALENVSGRLIEAQEKERSRIARDLHDDICQRLALLSMELEQANRSLNASPEVTNERLEEIRRHCSEITGDVQALSHQLHSSKLDYLGITAAIRSFCREFAKQHDGTVEFNAESIPTHLPKDVSLCLFRIVQESLHNAVKYSGTNRYTVHLKGACNNVQLEVADSGVGFDPETAKVNGGLGLLSMQERVHLVRGEFFLESSPGKGTRILASVPMSAETPRPSSDGDEAARVTGVA
ncbi:MAG TPA: PAS domain-containing sensor histidine kinase, partial [Terriglobales bacterium]